MDYNAIIQLSQDYTNRSDTTTVSKLNSFISIVESRVNKKIKTMDMITLSTFLSTGVEKEFDLPNDYAGARLFWYETSGGIKHSMIYATPDFIVALDDNPNINETYYTIVGNKIRMPKVFASGDKIKMEYFKKVPNLTLLNSTNWLSDDNPDCYVFGLCVEIESYWKNSEAAVAWNERFKESIADIIMFDDLNKHSKQPLTQTVG